MKTIKEEIKHNILPVMIALFMVCLLWGPIYLMHLDDKNKHNLKNGFGEIFIIKQYGSYGARISSPLSSRSSYYSWNELKTICPNSIKKIQELENEAKSRFK